MNDVFLATGTVTFAMRAKEILRRKGIRAIPKRRSLPDEYGCGYGVLVSKTKSSEAEQILIKNGVKVLGMLSA